MIRKLPNGIHVLSIGFPFGYFLAFFWMTKRHFRHLTIYFTRHRDGKDHFLIDKTFDFRRRRSV